MALQPDDGRRLRLVFDAEREVAAAASVLTTPDPRECVLCFVHRMVESFGCDNHLRWTRRWRDLRAPRATALERRMERKGGYCDCEIFSNCYVGIWPGAGVHQSSVIPACLGVSRVGSARPCGLWASHW